jgi:molybdenum cofactor guanylyltransferase
VATPLPVESTARTSLLILAGGRATRLGGRRKALLRIGDRPILERVLNALSPLADECLALVQDADLPAMQGLRLVVDPRAHAGVLPALAHGLRIATGDVCLLVASDMPFVSRAAFASLLGIAAEEAAPVVVPYVDGHLEPMHAVVSRRALLEAVESAQRAGEQRLFKVLQMLNPRLVDAAELRLVDPHLHTLFNVNTPEDLVLAERILRGQAVVNP